MTSKKLPYILALMLVALPAHAGIRESKRYGVSVGAFTAPMPSTLGYSLFWNLADQIQLGAGYGILKFTEGTGSSAEAQAKVFFFSWNATPYFSFGATKIFGNVSGSADLIASVIDTTGLGYTGGIGVEWQTSLGMTLGLEFKGIFVDPVVAYAPGFYVGITF